MDFPTLTDTPTTWAGLAPTHPTRPVYYELAQAASEDAWLDVSDAVDAGEPSDMVYERQQAALICDQLKADQYRWWMTAGFNPTRAEPSEHIRHMVGE